MSGPIRRPPHRPPAQLPADDGGREQRVERARAELARRGMLRSTEHDPQVVRSPDGAPLDRLEPPRPRGGIAVVGYRRRLPGDSTEEDEVAPTPRPDRSYSEEPDAPTLADADRPDDALEGELEGELVEVDPPRPAPARLAREQLRPPPPPPTARPPAPRAAPPRAAAPRPPPLPRRPPARVAPTIPPTARELWRDLSAPGADPVGLTREAIRLYLTHGHLACLVVSLLGIGALAGVGVAAIVVAASVLRSPP